MSDLEPFVVEAEPAAADATPAPIDRPYPALDDIIGLSAAVVSDTADDSPHAPAGEIQLFDPSRGEVTAAVDARRLLACAGLVDPSCVDIEAALAEVPFEALVTFAAHAAELASVVKEADNAVRYELPLRLDRQGSWTRRELGYVVESPSPEAGTRGYDSEKLRSATQRLVEEKLIEPEAAAKALEVVPTPALVPYATLRLILDALDGELDQPGYLTLREQIATSILDEPEPRLVQHPNGIKALAKLPAAKAAIAACEIPLEPPRRRATVKPLPTARTR